MDKRNEEDRVNGDALRQAREARGWNWLQVAQLSSLSVAQVKALENGGTDCFYSPSIKINAARKVALVLGVSDVMNASTRPNLSEPTAELQTITLAPATDNEVASKTRHPTTQGSDWMGYSALSLIFVMVIGGSALQLEPLSGDVAGSETVPLKGSEVIAKSRLTSDIPPANQSTQPAQMALATLDAAEEPACAFGGEAEVLEAANPTQSAAKVSLLMHKAGLLCVQDGSGKVWQENLQAGLDRTFVGKAPWKLHSAVLPNAEVFFQGEKIKLTSVSTRTIVLTGKAVQ